MKVMELIDALDNMDPEAEVRLAIQPNYPFSHYINRWDPVVEDNDIVYIAEGGQESYLPGSVRGQLGW